MGYAKLTLDRADQSVATSFSSTIGFFKSKANRLLRKNYERKMIKIVKKWKNRQIRFLKKSHSRFDFEKDR